MSLRSAYVSCSRVGRTFANRIGLLRWLDGFRSRPARWVRSLFAIYDVDDMIKIGDPWWTYRAIDDVDRFLQQRPAARAFEYGSGASTIWLAERCASVHSVEYDEPFATVMKPHLPANVELLIVPPTETAEPEFQSGRHGFEQSDFRGYVSAIDDVEGNFDLIVIDGRARVACLERAEFRLAPGGMIVFDNSERRRYRDALSATSLHVNRRRGAAPSLPHPSTTALLTVDRTA